MRYTLSTLLLSVLVLPSYERVYNMQMSQNFYLALFCLLLNVYSNQKFELKLLLCSDTA